MTSVRSAQGGLLLVDPATGFVGVRRLAVNRFEVWASTYGADDPGSRGQVTDDHLAELGRS